MVRAISQKEAERKRKESLALQAAGVKGLAPFDPKRPTTTGRAPDTPTNVLIDGVRQTEKDLLRRREESIILAEGGHKAVSPEEIAQRKALAEEFEKGQKITEEKLARTPEEKLKGFKSLAKAPISRTIEEPFKRIPVVGSGLQDIKESALSSIFGRQELFGFKFSIGSDKGIADIFGALISDRSSMIIERQNVIRGSGDPVEFFDRTNKLLEDIDIAEENIKQKSIFSGELTSVEGQVRVMSELDAQRRYILANQDAVILALRTGKIGSPAEGNELIEPAPFEF